MFSIKSQRGQNDRIATNFMLVSDTQDVYPEPPYDNEVHTDDDEDERPRPSPYREPLPRCDVFIHAGDLSSFGKVHEYEDLVNWLKYDVRAEIKIVIGGNRDPVLDTENYAHIPSDHKPHKGYDHAKINRRCRRLLTNQDAINHNIYYLENEAMTFNLSNSATFTVFASPLSESRPGGRGFFQYAKEDPSPFDEMDIPEDVDILVTHGPPQGRLDLLDRNGLHGGCEKIWGLVERLKPLLHVFGHIHEGHGQEIVDWNTGAPRPLRRRFKAPRFINEPLIAGQETMFVNAAIVGNGMAQNSAVNSETLVTLKLPRQS